MRCYSHLSDDEREQIGLLKALGQSIGVIAKSIRRPKSTVLRELSRNKLPSGHYSPLHAAGAYQLRSRKGSLVGHAPSQMRKSGPYRDSHPAI
jgi:IS30 family transposase